ncbi:nitroreductase family protein [Actinomadura nitritigenes]|uniref:Nitroreductase family protein n=1 Tax=Actinomadura nitritigenes TaxID=134602 RepID=A0ABS3QU22_9ACTN|nr:nitroreductase family protein [Actinomadura nitritigenes]MBO2436899.1 nitroreductase family protein [Actinomadura nitritigenes]
METWNAITSRRNVREYRDEPIPPDDLDRVLEAARRAPSSRNWQPWDFVVVTDRDRLGELAAAGEYAAHVPGSAATIALVMRDYDDPDERETARFDLGQAMLSIMIAAVDLGIGSGHATVMDQAVARRVLGLPDDRFCAYLVALGYPAGRPLKPVRNPARRAFEDVVHRGRW